MKILLGFFFLKSGPFDGDWALAQYQEGASRPYGNSLGQDLFQVSNQSYIDLFSDVH